MNRNEMKKAEEPLLDEFVKAELDPVLKQALGEFKASVHAWSEAEFARPRTVHAEAHGLRRVALGWSIAGVLLAGGVSGVVMAGHHDRQSPTVATVHEAPRTQQRAAEPVQRASVNEDGQQAVNPKAAPVAQEEELLASVDSAVSRTVPSAMEPLVDMGTESGTNK
ncbi:MAG: hypothetical protein P4L40_18460 [Terracidiphilus sp.]|nr:hypothetical protein [Terracidiphilus sp.]